VALYLDTSAFFKLVMDEDHSVTLRQHLAESDTPLVSSDLMRVEAMRAARRHSPEVATAVRARLDVMTLLTLSTMICERAGELDPGIPRSLDAMHLASALTLGDDLAAIVTYDNRLASAAAAHGVAILAPR